jgi:hypothetical protein
MKSTDFIVARNDLQQCQSHRMPPDQGHLLSLAA